jgi:hypothetical protein
MKSPDNETPETLEHWNFVVSRITFSRIQTGESLPIRPRQGKLSASYWIPKLSPARSSARRTK